MNNLPAKGFQYLTHLAVTFGASLIAPFLIVLATLTFTLIIPGLVIDTTVLTLYFILTCTCYSIFLLATLSRAHRWEGEDVGHCFSLIIPAHNEENVIEQTVKNVLALDYPEELFEVVVVNDGSSDQTQEIVASLQKDHRNLKLLNVPVNKGGRGKSAALNVGFADFLLTWRGLEVRPRHRWIIGVFDSDANPQKDMLKKVSFQFNSPDVGAVQTLVRVRNRDKSILAKLQDIEFLGFARVVQFARNTYAGSVALGGNGQFVRATALDMTAFESTKEYWGNKNLTEDLELGVRLLTKQWKNVYIDTSWVTQEGTETVMTMFKQRERWAWGTFQTLVSYVFSRRFWTSKTRLQLKIDISIYLLNVLLPVMIGFSWILTGLSVLGFVKITNFFSLSITIAQGFSFLPLIGYGLWKQKEDYPRWQIVPLVFITTVYTYHWIPATMSALVKFLTTKPKWVKTPRFASKPLAI
jgi:1,2-diacylglycerol 3-beta-glucosyltransferase